MTDSTPATPAGWYPDQAQPELVRYWDGTVWTEHTQPAAGYVGSDTPGTAGAPAVATEPLPPIADKKPWWKRKRFIIPIGVVAALIIIPAAFSGGGGDDDEEPASPVVSRTVEPAAEETPEPEPVDTTVEVPDMVGMTVAEAVAALKLVNITLDLPEEVKDDWIVSSQTVDGGDRIEPGDALSISAGAPEPVYTLSQQNAIDKGLSYLDYSGFSRQGLIDQLVYEGYSAEDATFAADTIAPDWNAEAAEKAQSYLDYSSFSREGLYDQLAFENFTPEQIESALKAVGY